MGTYKQAYLLKTCLIIVSFILSLSFTNSYSQPQNIPIIDTTIPQWKCINDRVNFSNIKMKNELWNNQKVYNDNRFKFNSSTEHEFFKAMNSNTENWTKINGPEGGSVRGFYKYFDSLYALTDREIYIYRINKWEPMNFHKIGCNSITDLFVDSTGKMLAGTDFDLYSSLDRGNNWNLVGGDINEVQVRGILKLHEDSLLIATNEGIFIGASSNFIFTKLNTEITNLLTLTIGKDNEMWAGTWDGIYKAKYPELIWMRTNIDTASYWQILINKRGIIYSSTGYDLCKSTDKGESWEYMNGVYCDDIVLEGDSDLVVANYNRILRINEAGVYWISTESEEFLLTVFIENNYEWFVGALGYGALKYNTVQNYYSNFNEGMQSATLRAIEILKNKSILVNIDYHTFYMSYDNGKNWYKKRNGWTRCTKQDGCGNLYVAENSGLIKSTDFGETWMILNINVDPYYINAMDKGNDCETICVGSSVGDVYLSTDNGINFKEIANRNYYFVEALKILSDGTIIYQSDSLYYSKNQGTSFSVIKDMYATAIIEDNDGYKYLAANWGIYRSLDLLHWTYLTSNPFGQPQKFELDSLNNLYAVFYGGMVLKTQDHGKSWIVVSNNIYNTSSWSFDMDNQGNMYCGTQDQGLYYCKIKIEREEGFITKHTLSNNYPNPFNTTTTIEYEIPDYSNVEIKIYDILGNEIETLVSEIKEEGAYHIVWNASSYSSGVYFYRIRAGAFIETKKMILLK